MRILHLVRINVFIMAAFIPVSVLAMGNHPGASVCTAEKPYQAICTHSLHSLEGWYGKCFATREQAQQDADRHAREQHNNNSRWTGIRKARFKDTAGY